MLPLSGTEEFTGNGNIPNDRHLATIVELTLNKSTPEE